MVFYVYILYSVSLDKYYIGQTVDLEKRLQQHNDVAYQESFTKRGNPWVLYFKLECISRNQAIMIERHIKGMKSKKYYKSLIEYVEVSQKLLERYK